MISSGKRSPILTSFLILWLSAVVVAAQGGGWLAEQFAIALGADWPGWGWPAIGLTQGALTLGPLLLLALLWREPRQRAVYRTWAIAAILPLLLIPIRLFPLPAAQRQTLWQIIITVIFGAGLAIALLLREKPRLKLSLTEPSLWLAMVGAGLLSYPWLAWGALGSLSDTALNLIAGLIFGLVSSLLLNGWLYPHLDLTRRSDQLGGVLAVGWPCCCWRVAWG